MHSEPSQITQDAQSLRAAYCLKPSYDRRVPDGELVDKVEAPVRYSLSRRRTTLGVVDLPVQGCSGDDNSQSISCRAAFDFERLTSTNTHGSCKVDV